MPLDRTLRLEYRPGKRPWWRIVAALLANPEEFYAIGQFYADFHQVSDEEVVALLERASQRVSAAPNQLVDGNQKVTMKSMLLLTASGALIILTSYASAEDQRLLKKLELKGIEKFVAFDIPLDLAKERYGAHFGGKRDRSPCFG